MTGREGPDGVDLTEILAALVEGTADTSEANEQLYRVAYDELRRIARRLMRRERPAHTLQATALVHEAYLKLVDQTRANWRSRDRFLGVASRAMRQILVDHARARRTAKRGGDWNRITLTEGLAGEDGLSLDILALHDAIEKLAAEDERAARVVELRVFGGLTAQEAARVLGVSKRTADSDWRVAQMWLSREMEP